MPQQNGRFPQEPTPVKGQENVEASMETPAQELERLTEELVQLWLKPVGAIGGCATCTYEQRSMERRALRTRIHELRAAIKESGSSQGAQAMASSTHGQKVTGGETVVLSSGAQALVLSVDADVPVAFVQLPGDWNLRHVRLSDIQSIQSRSRRTRREL
jgi:hypothetical protein